MQKTENLTKVHFTMDLPIYMCVQYTVKSLQKVTVLLEGNDAHFIQFLAQKVRKIKCHLH